MKNVRIIASLFLMAIIVASCGVAENGFGGSSIQKRKYTKGFYLSKNHSFKSAKHDKVNDSDVSDSEAIVEEQAVVTPSEQPTAQPVVRQQTAVVAHDQTTERNQKQQENQKTPAKKKATVDNKSSKPATPTRPRKEREHEYFIPVKQKANMNKQSASRGGGMDDGTFILAVIFAILIPPIGVLIYTAIDWKKVLICLLLTILFFLPGMIYALLIVFDVIG